MIKVLELFAGIGACSKALENLGIKHEIVDAVEIDKFAIQAFNAIHGTNFGPQDITKWDKDIECDLIMHGSPCQDFSIAGKQAGGDEGSGTRSSLMYETLRIVEKLRPKYVIWENVKNLLSDKHRHNFDAYLEAMEGIGYTNWYQVLNAKDYGVPQNRERVFTVSISDRYIIDNDLLGVEDLYKFPERQPLTKRLKDILEDKVDDKFYLSDKQVTSLINSNYDQNKRFYSTEGLSPTISTMGGGQRQPKIIQRPRGKNNGGVHDISPTISSSKWQYNNVMVEPYIIASRGRGENNAQHLEPNFSGTSNTLTSVQKDNYVATPYRIRKLTPRECYRLMGFDDASFERASKAVSNTQLYKTAGNSIVVNVLQAILANLIKEDK